MNTLLFHSMRAAPGSVSLIGVVCSTWLWVCQHSTGRRRSGGPGSAMGNFQTSKAVRDANAMVSRVLLVVVWLICRRCYYIVEQPADSCLDEHDRFRWFTWICGDIMKRYASESQRWMVEKVHTWLGLYGHESCKPTLLWSNAPWINETKRKMTKSLKNNFNKKLTRTVYIDGCKKVYGEKADMKESQAYPREFVDFIANKYIEHRPELDQRASDDYARSSSDSDYPHTHNDEWDDCDLSEWVGTMRQIWIEKGPGCPV